MAADGTTFTTTTTGIAALALDEAGIQRLARAAADIAVKAGRVLRLGFVKVGREHIEQVRERVERMAAQIVRDFLYSTPRGVRRAANQRRTGVGPASVLIPERLAAVAANALRDARARKRPSRSKAAAVAPPGATTAEECGIKPRPARDRGDPGLCDARRRDAAEIEIADDDGGTEPLLWLLALEARAEADAEAAEGAMAPPAPRLRPRPRKPRPILHLRRAAAGGAS